MSVAYVKYTGTDKSKINGRFTPGAVYKAYCIEFWEGNRDGLVVEDDTGFPSDFNHVDQFEVLSDPDHVLNKNIAVVKCISHTYEGWPTELLYGKQYNAIGCDKDNNYLVMDESYCCYFYPSTAFQIIDDPYHLLRNHSIEYSYHG